MALLFILGLVLLLFALGLIIVSVGSVGEVVVGGVVGLVGEVVGLVGDVVGLVGDVVGLVGAVVGLVGVVVGGVGLVVGGTCAYMTILPPAINIAKKVFFILLVFLVNIKIYVSQYKLCAHSGDKLCRFY
jgi:hypothetical protein